MRRVVSAPVTLYKGVREIYDMGKILLSELKKHR